MVEIKLFENRDLSTLLSVGKASFSAAYAQVLSADQIDFMLQKSYTETGILKAIAGGQVFYLLLEQGHIKGFMAVQDQAQKDLLRIEKLYLLPETQGKGYGRLLIEYAIELAQSLGLDKLELNVNRKNKAYFFYLKLGFEKIASVDIPYYGFILDDYIMQRSLR